LPPNRSKSLITVFRFRSGFSGTEIINSPKGPSASRLAIELVLNAAVEAVASDNHFTSSLQTDAGRNDMINEIRVSLNSRLPYDLSTDFCKESKTITDA
jgi:hypothetical protein